MEVQRLKAIAEQQRLKNAFLKAQLRPHLIFGTLNFIFHSVQEISESTADVIGRLAELIRYALKEPMADGRVPLDEELEHLENYLQLIRITHGGDLHFLYLLHQQPGKQLAIVPYILITFIENVFRHGDLSDVDDPAKIYLTIKDGLLTLRTINRKTKQARLSSGIGMVNMSQRLESEYNGRHSLVVSETETVYEITLVICL